MRKTKLEQSEQITFDIFFSGIVAMQEHPGIGRSNGVALAPPKKSVPECADLALEMIEVRRQVMGND